MKDSNLWTALCTVVVLSGCASGLVSSLRQNSLVWGGQSKTKNPANLDRLIAHTAEQVTEELVRHGLIAKEAQD